METVQLQREDAAAPWYRREASEVLAALDSTAACGLTSNEARKRKEEHGPNVLVQQAQQGPLRRLLAQFTDVMALVLLGAAAIAGFLGNPEDVVAITAIVVLNAILGFSQEYRAERAVAALKAIAAPAARVLRDAVERVVPAAELTPGDVVLVQGGSIVPADMRLIEVNGLRIEEAALTGESQPVEKTTSAIPGNDVPLGDQYNMAFKGTTVSSGRGVGVVVGTGMQTELGRIAKLLQATEEPRTPLQRRLARLGRNLSIVVVALCAVIFVAGLLRGEPPALMFMTALSLAVAAIPEALPAVVTVSLALGARKMVRKQALIRRLPAVETLGSVTYICTDKTGTLTENRMRVESLLVHDGPTAPPTTEPRDPCVAQLLEAIALNNDAAVGGDGTPAGEPTETALYRAAAAAGYERKMLELRQPRVAELPFSSERARMTTVHGVPGDFTVYTKGAPERVIGSCVARFGETSFGPDGRSVALAQVESLASSGMRVLAVAMRRLNALPLHLADVETDQVLVGLVGLLDPPRAEAAEAVALCQSAGIRVVMLTGDHPETARALASRVGIGSVATPVVTGVQLATMAQEELDAHVREFAVYARVAPEDKIRIVKALQGRGECVAMTGDGVNDAPALRRADIGVAMGRGGTDVAREASHMVLLDDNFATIVKAVREGRRIYDNIRRFVRYSLSTNSGEIWTLFLAPLIGLPLPLLPIHILWMNLVTDGLPGLALAAEPPAHDIMRRPPRSPNESIFARGLWQHIVWVGLLMAALALGTQGWAIHVGAAQWQSMTFTVLTLSQLAHVLAIRSEAASVAGRRRWLQRPLFGTVLLTVLLQLSMLYVPAMNRIFRTMPLTLPELVACMAVSSIVFAAVEAEKWIRRRDPDGAAMG